MVHRTRRTLAGRAALLGVSVAERATAVLMAFAIAAVVLGLSGYAPVDVFRNLAGSFVNDPWSTLRWATPLILTGLATAVAFRARVWNIGIDGQLFMGAAAGAAVALYIAPQFHSKLGILVVLLASAAGGALWALIPALLRAVWGAPEIITTLIFIEIARLFVTYLVFGPMKGNPAASASVSTNTIDQSLWLTPLVSRQPATVGFYIAVLAAVLVAVYVFRSRHGYELTVFGDNQRFAFYAGLNNRWIFVRTMMVSGALAGLAGGLELLGALHRLPSMIGVGLGFQGIAVSLVAAHHPLGIAISGIFFGGLKAGGTNLQRVTDTPREVVDIVSAVVILVVTARIPDRLLQRRRAAIAAAHTAPQPREQA